jgi:hypothetical protein
VYSGPELPFIGDVPKYLPRDAAHVGGGCSFTKCPAGPFIHVLTTHMNLPFRYLRMLWSLDRAADGLLLNGQPLRECMCAMAGDFVDNRREPYVEYALRAWPGDSLVVNVSLPFARGKALQACKDVVATPANNTILLLLDNDICVFPGFFEKLLPGVVRGESFVVLAPWSTEESDSGVPGIWRPSNTGSIAFYLSDLRGGIPGQGGTYGGEDTALVNKLMTRGRVRGRLVRWPELWHIAHPQLWMRKQLDTIGKDGRLSIDSHVWFPPASDVNIVAELLEQQIASQK